MRKIALSAISLAMLSTQAFAWGGVITGKISMLEGASAPYPFMVRIIGEPAMCGGGTAVWAYLDSTNGNYQVMASMIISAQMSGKTVTFYTAKQESTNYCRIDHLQIHEITP